MFNKRSINNCVQEQKAKQPAPRGCCCKRSQCIKNYCDCYQSMAVCSIHCKCIGCRNTEQRMAVTTPPLKTAIAAKRERAAALSAKAAAAAAKAGINIHLRPAPGSAAFEGQQFGASAMPSAASSPILQVFDMDVGNIITLPPPNTIALPKKPQATLLPSPKSMPPKEINIIKPPITVALLERMLLQATEATEVDMNPVQGGKLVLKEFARGLREISDIYSVDAEQ
ncbi:protein tesmin/TSO1-like CXC 5 [Drosophila grimshawi]|uniref:GH11450 n=1 Tax=Drosophila grimshawi TaxID=7222 RepID=B4JAF5_DROGR|nr:protein tesmin/TSO1-like CXC 5 [Drosophila grimshawi]EDW03826.1 GH11450 [Drosophila grimshawi]